MLTRTIAACCLTLFLIARSATAQIDALSGRAPLDKRRPPEQDAGWNLGHTRPIRDLDFSPDGKWVVSCAEDHTLRLWRAQTGALVRTIHTNHDTPLIAQFTPDGHAILAALRNKTLGLWSVSGKPLAVVNTPDTTFALLWTPDGSKLVAAESKGDIVVRSRGLRLLQVLHTHIDSLHILALAENGRVVICSQQAEEAPFALDLHTGQRVHGWFESPQIEYLFPSPDQRFAVIYERDDRQVIRSIKTGEVVVAKGVIGQDRVVFSRNGKMAFLIGFNGSVTADAGQLLSTATWKPLGPWVPTNYADVSALSSDGSVAAFDDEIHRNCFRLFSTKTGKIRWTSADPFLILGSKPSLTLLRQLSQDYTRYGLPLPPPSAKLAYVEPLGPPRTRPKEPTDRILTLVEPAGKGEQQARWYGGFRSVLVNEEEIVVPIAPEQATLKRTQPGDAVSRLIDDSDICMAVFCYRRGWSALGMEFLKRKLEGYRSDVRQDFADMAWSYWEYALGEPATDRKTAAKYLPLLFDAFKPLQTDHKQSLLADLNLTMQSSATHHTGIEGEIDALTEAAPRRYGRLNSNELDRVNPVLRALWLQGFEAVPFLIQHLDDRRLVYGEMTGITSDDGHRYPSHVMRVGEVVSNLLYILAGDGKINGDRSLSSELELANRKSAEQWWERAKAVGEEQYLLESILPVKDSKQDWPNALNAAILAYKYPEKLPGVYEELLDRFPKAQKWQLAEILARSKAPQAEKERLLVRTATTGDRDQRIGGFWALIKMNYPNTLDLLLARLDSLPPKPEGAYWLGEAGALGLMVQELDSPRGWDALERLARRSDVGQRLEILGDLSDQEARGQRKRHRIEFLARFLDDNTPCNFSGAAFEGPHADFDLNKITVRDSVLRSISYLVGVRHYPREDWKPEDWDAWRPEALAAMRRYLSEASREK